MPFKKGQSGNPGGRPKKNKEFETFCQEYLSRPTKKGKTLVESVCDDIFFGTEEKVTSNGDIVNVPHPAKVRLNALEYLSNYAFGKPRQSVAMVDSDGNDKDVRLMTEAELQGLIDE